MLKTPFKITTKLLSVSTLATACFVGLTSQALAAGEIKYTDQQKLHAIAGDISAQRIGGDIQTLVDLVRAIHYQTLNRKPVALVQQGAG